MSSKSTPIGISWKRWLVWSAVVVAGTASFGVLSFSRGESVNALWMVIAAGCVFAISWRFHSAWLAATVLTLDDRRATPAVLHEDGKDFVKTNRWIVFGHHFAAIAGPGPLVGPVLAAQFGYLPGMLWILIGATMGGAVHDMVCLFCSTRRKGKSLGQIVRDEIGPFAGLLALVSIVGIMVILLAVLGLVVVKALAESPWGLSTIVFTIPIAVAMGLMMRLGKGDRLVLVSIVGMIGLLLSVLAGQYVTQIPALEKLFTIKDTTLAWWIMGYGLSASVLPVWLLLAPRDYLSTFMKIGVVAALGIAIVILRPVLHMPALTKFVDGSGPVFAGPVFPFCFITIACAAVSGFHSLVATGTTPKMLKRESDIRTIGYGAMIVEMLVGIMALIAACAMQPGEYLAINMKGEAAAVTARATSLGFPVTEAQMTELAGSVGEKSMIGRAGGAPTFAVGMAKMFAAATGSKSALAVWYHFAIMFEALFILTTIDAGTRVGRFLVQDLLGFIWKPMSNTRSTSANWIASTLFVSAWGWFLYAGVIDPLGGINSLWPIFGIANQLLGVIALAVGTTVLIKMGRARFAWVTLLPLGWLLAVTTTAGWMKLFSADPRIGFLSAAAALKNKIPPEMPASALEESRRLILNNYVNAVVTGFFVAMVLVIFSTCVREWVLLLSKRRIPELREEAYVPLGEASSV